MEHKKQVEMLGIFLILVCTFIFMKVFGGLYEEYFTGKLKNPFVDNVAEVIITKGSTVKKSACHISQWSDDCMKSTSKKSTDSKVDQSDKSKKSSSKSKPTSEQSNAKK